MVRMLRLRDYQRILNMSMWTEKGGYITLKYASIKTIFSTHCLLITLQVYKCVHIRTSQCKNQCLSNQGVLTPWSDQENLSSMVSQYTTWNCNPLAWIRSRGDNSPQITGIDNKSYAFLLNKNNLFKFSSSRYHSLNIQAMCDAQRIFTNVVCRWPGSTHDNTIFTQSQLHEELQAGYYGDSWVLGKWTRFSHL